MATRILGISAFYHDSAAALVKDGQVVAAAQEERFTRKKFDEGFPHQAIDYCLEHAGLRLRDLDNVVFYDKPFLKFERLLETYLAYRAARLSLLPEGDAGLAWRKTVPEKHADRGIAADRRRTSTRQRLLFTEHHQAHAASAFYPSPFEEALVLTRGRRRRMGHDHRGRARQAATSSILSRKSTFPHSLGLLYSAFTYYLGFRVNSGEYKLMGLAPYGEPRYRDLIRDNLIDLKPDGSFRLDMSYFNYCTGLTMTNAKFDRLFGRPVRESSEPLTQEHMDIAASAQVVLEEAVLAMTRGLAAEYRPEKSVPCRRRCP